MTNHKLSKHIKLLLLLMLCSISTTLFAQQRMVKGTVVDEQGESLIGVSVTVKNAQKGTITDVNGEFSLQLPAEKTLLVFTYIGYETVAVWISTFIPNINQ